MNRKRISCERPATGYSTSVLDTQRACDACGGAVDVMTLDKPLDSGGTVPTKIGACLRCGKWFNEAGLIELAHAPPPPSADSPA